MLVKLADIRADLPRTVAQHAVVSLRGCRGSQLGFTYMAVLMLVAAMGIGFMAVSQVWYTALQREKEEELLFVGDQIRRAIGYYYASTPGKAERYPRALEDLLKDSRYPGTKRYLRKVYRDPISNSTEWGLVKTADGAILGVYSLSQKEPLKKGGFDREDKTFEGKAHYSDWYFIHKPGQVVAPRPSKRG